MVNLYIVKLKILEAISLLHSSFKVEFLFYIFRLEKVLLNVLGISQYGYINGCRNLLRLPYRLNSKVSIKKIIAYILVITAVVHGFNYSSFWFCAKWYIYERFYFSYLFLEIIIYLIILKGMSQPIYKWWKVHQPVRQTVMITLGLLYAEILIGVLINPIFSNGSSGQIVEPDSYFVQFIAMLIVGMKEETCNLIVLLLLIRIFSKRISLPHISAIVLTSCVFGAMHHMVYDNLTMIRIIFEHMPYILVTLYTKSILPAAIAHMLHNLLVELKGIDIMYIHAITLHKGIIYCWSIGRVLLFLKPIINRTWGDAHYSTKKTAKVNSN